MPNRVKAANDALAAKVEATFSGAGYAWVRNPEGATEWMRGEAVVAYWDDKSPETLNVLSGGVHDLQLSPEIMIVRRATEASRAAGEWADVDALEAALAADRTLGGVVEDARCADVEGADHDEKKWLGGGLRLAVRLLFNAPSAVG